MVQASTFEGPLDFDKENGDFLQWGRRRRGMQKRCEVGEDPGRRGGGCE